MLDCERPDFALITLPHNLALESVKACAERSISVLKEKPLALNLEESDAIKDFVDKYKIHFSIIPPRRLLPIFQAVKESVPKIGHIYYSLFRYNLVIDQLDEGFRASKALAGGGCLIDMGYHYVDLIDWYLGGVEVTSSSMSRLARPTQNYDVEDTCTIQYITNREKSLGSLHLSRAAPPKKEMIHLVGDQGAILLEDGIFSRFNKNGQIMESLVQQNKVQDQGIQALKYFVNILNGKAPNFGSVENHISHMGFIEKAYSATSVLTI